MGKRRGREGKREKEKKKGKKRPEIVLETSLAHEYGNVAVHVVLAMAEIHEA